MPAKTNTPAALGGTKPSPDEPESNRAMKDLAMAHTREIPVREIVFVDPGVSDIETLLGNLRPEVEAILLDRLRPATHQIAAALAGQRDLAAIHIVAHGAPGRVNFAAGDWSAETSEEEAEDLAAIGQALATSGDLRLWSCQTAAGPPGAAFVAGLAQATGAATAAASGLVGAAAHGGRWELTAAAQPPLTGAVIAEYAAVLAAVTWKNPGTGGNWSSGANWTGGSGTGGVPGNGDTVTLQTSSSSTYTVTVDASTSTIASLQLGNASGNFPLTLLIDSGVALNVSGTVSTGASDNKVNQIQMLGTATLNAGTLNLSAGSGTLSGSGTLNVSGHIQTGTALTASGNNGNTTLDVFGTIDSGVVLAISSATASDLKIEGTATSAAAIANFNNVNQTLEIGASGALTIGAAQNVTAGTIQLDGGSLSDASGITVGTTTTGGAITGSGTIAVNLNRSGTSAADTITASGGTLDLTGTVGAATAGLALGINANAILEIANTVASG